MIFITNLNLQQEALLKITVQIASHQFLTLIKNADTTPDLVFYLLFLLNSVLCQRIHRVFLNLHC